MGVLCHIFLYLNMFIHSLKTLTNKITLTELKKILVAFNNVFQETRVTSPYFYGHLSTHFILFIYLLGPMH
jgi:hypothetical protein